MTEEIIPTEEVVVVETASEEPKRRSRKVAEEVVAEVAVEAPVEVPAAPAPKAAKEAAPAYPVMALTAGGSHESIKAAQKKLGVEETGAVDAATKNAVKVFQKASGIKVDGNMSAAVWAKIFS